MSENTVKQIASNLNIFELPYVTFKNRDKLPKNTGIYIVSSNKVLLYIGMTTNDLNVRWQTHHRTSQLQQFKNVVIHYFVCSESTAYELEQDLIKLYPQVLLNSTSVPNITDNNNVVEQLIERGDTKVLTELLQEVKELKITVDELYSENIRMQELIRRKLTIM